MAGTVFNAFNRSRGDSQQRVVSPDNFQQTETAAYVLGSDDPSVLERLEVGDHAEVERTFDATGMDTLTARIRVRSPRPASVVGSWDLVVLVDAVEYSRHRLPNARSRTWDTVDATVNVSQITGSHDIHFRLELAGVA